MSTIINLRCIDQVLTFESTPVIASGGLEENFIQVEFCDKWDGLTKTAVFWRSEDDVYHVPLDEDDSCTIPAEVLADEGVIYFGLFGVSSDGRQRTSGAMRYTVAQGAITEGTKPSDPTPDIYTELLAKYQEMIEVSEATLAAEQAFEQAMTAAQAAFEQAMGERQTQHETDVDTDQAAFEQAMAAAQEAFEQEILAMIAAGLLPDDSVTTVKLKDGVVTTAKLATDVQQTISNTASVAGQALNKANDAQATAAAAKRIVTIKEVTTTAAAAQVEFDLSDIDLDRYQELKFCMELLPESNISYGEEIRGYFNVVGGNGPKDRIVSVNAAARSTFAYIRGQFSQTSSTLFPSLWTIRADVSEPQSIAEAQGRYALVGDTSCMARNSEGIIPGIIENVGEFQLAVSALSKLILVVQNDGGTQQQIAAGSKLTVYGVLR